MATLTDERDLACTRCGKTVTVSGGDWIDANLYECPACRDEQTATQRTIAVDEPDHASVRDDWHGRYDPWMAEIPF